MTVLKTRDYSIFKKSPHNRDIDKNNIRRLTASIRTRNLLEFRPIMVNSSFEVIDGQHRLEVAKALELDIYYKIDVESTPSDIITLNSYQKTWGPEDYLNYYRSLGNEEYDKIIRFKKEQDIDLKTCLAIMNYGAYNDKFKQGRFQFPSGNELIILNEKLNRLKEVIYIINTMKVGSRLITTRKKFISGLVEILGHEDLDFDKFKEKLKINLDKVRLCSGHTNYVLMFREIYNWKNRSPLEL